LAHVRGSDHEVVRQSHLQIAGELAKTDLAKSREVAADPYAPNNNLAKLQGREAYRLRVGGWRVIYEAHGRLPHYSFWMWGREGGFTDAH
jgi:hypothetical protein